MNLNACNISSSTSSDISLFIKINKYNNCVPPEVSILPSTVPASHVMTVQNMNKLRGNISAVGVKLRYKQIFFSECMKASSMYYNVHKSIKIVLEVACRCATGLDVQKFVANFHHSVSLLDTVFTLLLGERFIRSSWLRKRSNRPRTF